MKSVSKTLRALFLGVALVSLMVACAGYLFLSELRRPASDSTEVVEFVVEPGASTTSIATNLRAAGLIRQPLLFTTLVRRQNLDGQLRAGTYYLRPSMTMSEIISALQITQPVEERQLLVREGLRLEEVAQVVGAANLEQVDQQTFLQTASNGAAFKDEFFLLSSLPDGATLEGYLFPDTYRLEATATVTDVINTMLARFSEQYQTFETEVQVDASVHEIVTMASIVQREAANEAEMPKVAAVFWNRLKPENAPEFGGGKLGADPTVQYLLGTPDEWWPKLDTLTTEQIDQVGADGERFAYNTRANAGLPPGPIASPGLAALEAAAKPDDSAPYTYFVLACGEQGHRFATSNEEFLQYEQEYLNCAP